MIWPHLSISPLHHSHGCSRSYCKGRLHSVSDCSRVRCTGHATARSLPGLNRTPRHGGRIPLSRIPIPGTPHQPHGGPSRDRKQSPTGHGEAPQPYQNTCFPRLLVWPHLWTRDKLIRKWKVQQWVLSWTNLRLTKSSGFIPQDTQQTYEEVTHKYHHC